MYEGGRTKSRMCNVVQKFFCYVNSQVGIGVLTESVMNEVAVLITEDREIKLKKKNPKLFCLS